MFRARIEEKHRDAIVMNVARAPLTSSRRSQTRSATSETLRDRRDDTTESTLSTTSATHEREPDPAFERHRLVQDPRAGDELQDRGDELQQADHGERRPSRPAANSSSGTAVTTPARVTSTVCPRPGCRRRGRWWRRPR
jgi:hypothetical protein